MFSFRLRFTFFLIASVLFTQEAGIAAVFSNPFVPTEIELESENETKKEELESLIVNSLKSKPSRNSKPYKYYLPNASNRITSPLTLGFYQKNSRTVVYHSLLI
jgi:hypothetical protein